MIGRYYVVIDTARGPVPIQGSMRVTTTDRPGVGDTITLHGVPHTVMRVRHCDSDIYEDGVMLTEPMVFVAPCYVARALDAERRAGVRS